MACHPKKQQLGTSRGPTKDGLKIGHLNARSMVAEGKMTDIRNFGKMHDFDIFTISETWLSDMNTKTRNKIAELEIEGYEKIERADRPLEKKERGGSLAVYVRLGIDYARITDNNLNDEIMQHIHIVVKSNREGKERKTIPYIHISAVYITPESECKKRLLQILDYHQDHTNVIVLGDVNIDEFKQSRKHTNNITQRGFCQLINEITRPSSRTLLDHIYVRRYQVENMITESGVVQCSISDHDLIFCTVSTDFMKRDFSTPMKAYKTILRGSGHMKAADQLCTLCKAIVCKIAKNSELDVSALVYDKAITKQDFDRITKSFKTCREQFWEQYKRVRVREYNNEVHNEVKVFCVQTTENNAMLELKFLWLAIGLNINGLLSEDEDKEELASSGSKIIDACELDQRILLLDFNKWSKTRKQNLVGELQDHGRLKGCGAVAVHYKYDDDVTDTNKPYWYACIAYRVFKLTEGCQLPPVLFGNEFVGCKFPKAKSSTDRYIQVLALIITALEVPGVEIVGWEPFGKQHILSNKDYVLTKKVQRYILKEYRVIMMQHATRAEAS